MTHSSHYCITEDALYELEKTIHNKSIILNQYLAFGLNDLAENLKKDIHDSTNRLAQMKLSYYALLRAQTSAKKSHFQNGNLPLVYHESTPYYMDADESLSSIKKSTVSPFEEGRHGRLAAYIPGQKFRVLPPPPSSERGPIRLKQAITLPNNDQHLFQNTSQ